MERLRRLVGATLALAGLAVALGAMGAAGPVDFQRVWLGLAVALAGATWFVRLSR